MYSIYFNDRIIRVCNKNITTPYNPNAAVLHSANNKTLQELPCLFEQNKNLKYLYIPILPCDLEETLSHLCSTLTPINAGGGLVQNTEGEYLLIFRNGLWDLPKGKQEEGEEISLTALREVEEECGITGLEQGELLCITHHTYHMNGLHMLKHTYWYKMTYKGDCATAIPQQEEGISRCEWVPASRLPEYLQDTYPSIRKVFEEAGLL
ncbi:MAG: NUDIX domain-containing protein [Bacteroidales bacterium]|nr:NUDIX domain-containing protein [Bacteroidales bacterium]MBR2438063.1 NUDIX domain-containing protein [Bacteroidales bacterium]